MTTKHLFRTVVCFVCLSFSTLVNAAPYAAIVVDARSGAVLHARNADSKLHPASLVKMMTLYIAFQAINDGSINLDDHVRISAKAASEPPSKLGLESGQRIEFRYLLRAAAIKSANDAATAIAEAVSGSEEAFVLRMNKTAVSMGMTESTFQNAHGLTEAGQLSTAKDLAILSRFLLYDFPEYYNLFSRVTASVGERIVSNTNRVLLASYSGLDGIKTGYTRASGFGISASAERGGKRLIVVVLGGESASARNKRASELLDLGFGRA